MENLTVKLVGYNGKCQKWQILWKIWNLGLDLTPRMHCIDALAALVYSKFTSIGQITFIFWLNYIITLLLHI